MAEQEFIMYYKNLPKSSCLCRIYERNDSYYLYGDDTKLLNKVLPATRIKTFGSEEDDLSYVKVTKGNLVRLLRHLLFVMQYRIEIFRNTGSGRSQVWDVVGMASPGNLTAVEDFLFSDENYVLTSKGLIAVNWHQNEECGVSVGVAYCDALLREIQICQFYDNLQFSMLQSVLAQLSPQECILPATSKSKPKEQISRQTIEEILKIHHVSHTESGEFRSEFIVQDLNRLLRFDEGQDFQNSMKEESEKKLALSCVAAVIKYLELLSDENNFSQYFLSIFKSELYAKVDSSCELGLGLFPAAKSEFHDKSYLFGHLNSCFTTSGERLLIQWIKQPLMDLKKLEERLDIVEIFVKDISLQNDVAKLLEKFLDVEIFCRKIQKHKAGLQDLYKIYCMLVKLPQLRDVLLKYTGSHIHVLKQNFIDDLQGRIEDFENFTSMIQQTIDFDAIQDRWFVVKADYDETLLDLKKQITKLTNSMQKELESMKNKLSLPSLKLEQFQKIGYTFRVTLKEESRIRNKKEFIVYDTRSSGVRFQSTSLKEINEQYLALQKEYEELQKSIVDEMVNVSASYIQPLKILGSTIAWLDVALSLARVANNAPKTYVRPKLKEKGENHIVLKQCRHPFLEDKVQNFIPNDVEITKEKHQFYFVTGPNMGGKSTFIRSVALNVLLAQIGSFVPCDEATISIVDAFFTRIGACDKPMYSISTFMYEMLEAKTMLSCASSASLMIIDEMGRGTSTFDGFGLSYAISKEIAKNIKAPCLFATHFHDLTDLSRTIPSIGNLHVDALCTNNDVTFLYRVKPGSCNESFGIHVAKLAGMPDEVIQDAEKKLKEIEDSQISFEDLKKAFFGEPNGEKIIDALKSFLPSELLPKSESDAMEIDGSELNNHSDMTLEEQLELYNERCEIAKRTLSEILNA